MSIFAEATKRAATARFKQKDVDAEGQEIEVCHGQTFIWEDPFCTVFKGCVYLFVAQYDVREDEEQNVKLKESIDLLLAAGYFRARIKGLSPFDKVHQFIRWKHLVLLLTRFSASLVTFRLLSQLFPSPPLFPFSVVQIVGGMTWCIQMCNFDVDIDLLFQENSTIGQKM